MNFAYTKYYASCQRRIWNTVKRLLAKIFCEGLNPANYFCKKAASEMFQVILNMRLSALNYAIQIFKALVQSLKKIYRRYLVRY